MKIEILTAAVQDLDAGRRFYQRQEEGLGAYFLDSLFSDIESLLIHAGVHQQFAGYYRGFPNASRTRSTIASGTTSSKSGGFWTAGKIRTSKALKTN